MQPVRFGAFFQLPQNTNPTLVSQLVQTYAQVAGPDSRVTEVQTANGPSIATEDHADLAALLTGAGVNNFNVLA